MCLYFYLYKACTCPWEKFIESRFSEDTIRSYTLEQKGGSSGETSVRSVVSRKWKTVYGFGKVSVSGADVIASFLSRLKKKSIFLVSSGNTDPDNDASRSRKINFSKYIYRRGWKSFSHMKKNGSRPPSPHHPRLSYSCRSSGKKSWPIYFEEQNVIHCGQLNPRQSFLFSNETMCYPLSQNHFSFSRQWTRSVFLCGRSWLKNSGEDLTFLGSCRSPVRHYEKVFDEIDKYNSRG